MTQPIEAVQCPNCLDVVISRHHYDLNPCSCGQTAVDGGREYTRVIYCASRPSRCFLLLDETELLQSPGIFLDQEAIEPGATYAIRGGRLVKFERA